MQRSILTSLTLLVASLTAGCGAAPPPASADPEPVMPLVASTAKAAPVAIDPAPEASAKPEASAAPEAPAPKKSSGRIAVQKQDDKQIQDTFGAAPAKLHLGNDKQRATLSLPDGALDRGYNITFSVDARAKSAGGQLGRAYRVVTQVAGNENLSKITSAGDPFEVIMPAGTKKDANLAIGTTETDAKGVEKVSWTIVAPTRIDDATNTAHFELTTIGGNTIFHVTVRAPSAGSAKGPK
jgi:hypothetical protein